MSDLISREALRNMFILESSNENLSYSEILSLITNTPSIEQGEAIGYRVSWSDKFRGAGEILYTLKEFESYQHVKPVKNHSCLIENKIEKLYTNPQQPQSVADALEEAAKEIDLMVNTYIESGNKYHEVSEGRERCVNKARAAMSCAETIRALIKRNAPKEGELLWILKM